MMGLAPARQAPGPGARLDNALPHELASAWRASKLPEGSLSLVVQELGGQRLLSINAKQPRNPASVMKLITTWSALSSLGPDYVWRTELLSEPGARAGRQWRAARPLYLRASGDPLFLMRDLWTLLRDLRLHGVRQINDLVIDRTIFGSVATDPGAFGRRPRPPLQRQSRRPHGGVRGGAPDLPARTRRAALAAP